LSEILNKNREAIVDLEVRGRNKLGEVFKNQGMGIVVSNQGHLLTAAHLLSRDKESSDVRIIGKIEAHSGEREYRLNIISKDLQLDLALLRLPSYPKKWTTGRLVNPVNVSFGDPVIIIERSLRSGLLTALEAPIYSLSSSFGSYWVVKESWIHGFGGAPVFNMQGGIVGIVSAAVGQDTFILPVSYARNILQTASVEISDQIDTASEEFFDAEARIVQGVEIEAYQPSITLNFEESIPNALLSSDRLSLNQQKNISVKSKSTTTNSIDLYVKDRNTDLKPGLNLIETQKRKILFWQEDQKLKRLKKPYQKIYAIIVAINDYARKSGSAKLPPTNFQPLTLMVENAKKT
jgi:trypsin-like peptidase